MRSPLIAATGAAWGIGLAILVSMRMNGAAERRGRRPWTPFVHVGRDLAARHARRRHADAMRRAVPIGFDLVIIAIAAGASIHHAIAVASRWTPSPLRERLRDVTAGVRLGLALTTAFERVAAADAEFARFADAIVVADRSGAPIANQLRAAASDIRRDQRHAAERRARRTSVQLLFPLVLLVFPAFVLLALAPLAISGVSGL